MDLYNCKVRLHADVRDEVRKRNVTAGEIRIFRLIHGEDAVVDVVNLNKPALSSLPGHETAVRDEAEERDRLEGLYGEKIVAQLYGTKAISLTAEIVPEPDEIEPTNRRPGRPRKEDVIGV